MKLHITRTLGFSKIMQRVFNVVRVRWGALLLSLLFCIVSGFIIAIAWFNLPDKIYSNRDLVLIAFGISGLLIGGVWFVIEDFLRWLKSKQIIVNRTDYIPLLTALLLVITAIYSVWISYGSKEFLTELFSKFEVEIRSSNKGETSGGICILEIEGQDGRSIRPENNPTSGFGLSGGWSLKSPSCKYFLPEGAQGALRFYQTGKSNDVLQILFRENKDSGGALIHVNGEQIAELSLQNELGGNKLVSVPLKFSNKEILFWHIMGTAGWTAILAILLMTFIPSLPSLTQVRFPSQVASLFDLTRKYHWISLIPIVVAMAVMFWPPGAYRSPDVAYYLSLAKNLYHGNGYVNPDLSPNIYRGPVFPILISLSYCLFGEAFRSAVIMERVFWVFTVLLSYILGKQLFNHRVGFLTSLFVLSSISINTAFYFVWTDGPLTFMVLLLQWMSWNALSKHRGNGWYVLMGMTMGLAYLLKQTAIFIAPMPLLMWVAIAEYRTGQTLKKLFIYYAVFTAFLIGWMGYVYLVGGSPTQVAGDLNIGLSVISRFSSILSAGQALSTQAVTPHSYSISFFQIFSTYYSRDIVKFYKIAPVILFALGFTLFQAVVKKSRPDIQLSIGLLLFSSLIPIQVVANFGFRQNLYFFTVGMICIAALIERLFNNVLSKTISGFIVPIMAVCLILVQLSGTYFLHLNPVPITDPKTLNYFSEYQTIAAWIEKNVKPAEKILIDERDGNILHILTNGNRVFEIINNCRGEKTFWPAVACTPPYISFWIYNGTTNPDDPRDVLNGISESSLLSTIQEKNVEYIFVTPRIHSLYYYLKRHPDFEEVVILGNSAIFHINHPVRSILNYPHIKWETCVGAGTPAYLKNLKESNPARYETRLHDEIEPWMGLSEKDITAFQNWPGCQFEELFPGEYRLP